ncbi:MAG: hypothetical protein ACI4EJ_08215 [Bacteroides sp.]
MGETELIEIIAIFTTIIIIMAVYHVFAYELTDAVCVSFKDGYRGYEGTKFYPATYEYEIDGEKHSAYAEAIWKPKPGRKCKVFVHRKDRNKIVPYSSVVELVTIALIIIILCLISLIGLYIRDRR